MKLLRDITTLLLLACGMMLQAKTIYLKTGGSSLWEADGADKFAAWHWKGSGEGSWSAWMTRVDGNLWKTEIGDTDDGIIFCRFDKSLGSPVWNESKIWNKTEDLAIPSNKDCFTITAWGEGDGNKICSGQWSAYDVTRFYITGNSALVTSFDTACKAWDPAAIASKRDTFTFHLKAGIDYVLKVTEDGTWKTTRGFNDLTNKAVGLKDISEDHNIGFKLKKDGDVHVIFTAEQFEVIGDFHVVHIRLVPGMWNSDNAKFAAWTWGKDLGASRWTPFFTGKGDTLSAAVNADADSIIFVRLNSSISAPKWNSEEETDNVWNEAQKTRIDYQSLTFTITGYGEGENAKSTGTWDAVGLYYLSGDSALVHDATQNSKKAWDAQAIKSLHDTCVLLLKGGVDYRLKVCPDGTWSASKGFSDLTAIAGGLNTDKDNNICFRLVQDGQVDVIYTENVFKLQGDFYQAPINPETQQRLQLVPYRWHSDNAKIAAYVWGKKITSQWTAFFTGDGDTLETAIPVAADSMVLVRFRNRDIMSPTWDNEEENVWNKIDKILIDHTRMVYTVCDWTSGTWESFIPATFYLTGDETLVVDAGLDKAKAWDPKAFKATGDTLTIGPLKADTEYRMKVCPDGKLDGEHQGKGYSDLTFSEEGIYDDADNNIRFVLSKAGSVQVVYTGTTFRLIGGFKKAARKTVRLVPSEEWLVADAKFAAWVWGKKLGGMWTDFFAPVSQENDTLQIDFPITADSIDFVRFSPKTKTPSWNQKDQQVWGETKDKINYTSLVWSIVGWDKGQWTPVDRPCADFGLMIGNTYLKGKHNVLKGEYQILNVDLEAGQTFCIYNKCAGEGWTIDTYSETSYTNFTIAGGKYTVNETGTYNFYIKIGSPDALYVAKKGYYTQSVPSECTDVMMQAFYNESYNASAPGVRVDQDYKLGLGDTRWWTLTQQADTIGAYFDLVWLPPSHEGSGMGYHPRNYSNQNSNWGNSGELDNLIAALHERDTKVIADIVINHCEGWTSWCDFPTLTFGEFGTFYPDASYICRNDEVNAEWNKDNAKACYGKASGSYDDGENWDGARDWSHDKVYVQDMFKAYLKWMRKDLKYDGFRYDKGDGFNNWHHDNYNKAAGPYIAFMECYTNTAKIIEYIQGANYNVMALDFDTKWQAFDGIAGFDYSRCKGSGMLGAGMSKYAVTFIDSHDWFLREDNQNEFGGRGNSLTSALKDRLLQANAFLLGMPGVPCVFYPHWAKYQDAIKPMIKARKLAGIHSESAVSDEQAEQGGYQCTLRGKYGWMVLQLGNKTTHRAWDNNYKLIAKGPGYAMWVHRTVQEDSPTAIQPVEPPQPMILDPTQPMYNILGQRVDAGYVGIVIQNGRKYIVH